MKTFFTSLRALLVFTVLTGVVYPLVVTGLARGVFPSQAAGSLVVENGTLVGSERIAQGFSQPRYFWPRPSAVNYDASASGASNASVTSAAWRKTVEDRRAQGFAGDTLFASGSGLDPDVSPQAARAQAERVAKARGWEISRVLALIDKIAEDRQFAFLGEKRVNVLRLNLTLDRGAP